MLSKSDFEILRHLRSNARQTLTEISRTTKIPISTIFDRLRRLEENAVQKHTSLLNYQRIGYGRKQIFLKVGKEDRDSLLHFLSKHLCVNTISKIDNKFDFSVEIVFGKLQDYYAFIGDLERFNIVLREEYSIIEDIKKEAFLTDVVAVA